MRMPVNELFFPFHSPSLLSRNVVESMQTLLAGAARFAFNLSSPVRVR